MTDIQIGFPIYLNYRPMSIAPALLHYSIYRHWVFITQSFVFLCIQKNRNNVFPADICLYVIECNPYNLYSTITIFESVFYFHCIMQYGLVCNLSKRLTGHAPYTTLS